jgi:polyhydroxyalkanoate synthesis regulator phasin
MAFTEMTRARAEAIVKDLVKAGEVPRQRAQESIDELLERSRKNTEAVRALVQAGVQEQLHSLGIATKDDIARLEAKLDKVAKAPAAKAAGKATPAAKASKKSAAKKAASADQA